MMLTLKRGDSGIVFGATLSNERGNVNLANADVVFLFGNHEISADVVNPMGRVEVTLESSHTETVGTYDGEFRVMSDDGVETYPNDDYIKIRIMPEIGGE